VRPTFKDMTRAITAKAPITGNLVEGFLPIAGQSRVTEKLQRITPASHSVFLLKFQGLHGRQQA
jgi:hypothetical protein